MPEGYRWVTTMVGQLPEVNQLLLFRGLVIP